MKFTLQTVFITLSVSLMTACGGMPLAQPEGPTAQATEEIVVAQPESPLAPPTVTPTVEDGKKTEYAAENISLAPIDQNSELTKFLTFETQEKPIFNSWSNSGQQFAFVIPLSEELVDPNPPEGKGSTYGAAELWTSNVDGTNTKKVADQMGHIAVWSPDDLKIAYIKPVGVFDRELWVTEGDTNKQIRLAEPSKININNTDTYSDFIAWLDNDNLIYATYSLAGTFPDIRRNLWVQNVKTGQIQEVFVADPSDESWRNIDLAPDKVSIVGRTEKTLWFGELIDDNGQYRLGYIRTLISDDVVIPYWSPDSSRLAIKSIGLADNVLQILDLKSDRTTKITFPHTIATVDWSPDSRVLIVSNFGAGTGLPNRVYAVNADGTNLRQLDAFYFGYMQWSPDGQYLGLSVSTDTYAYNPFGIIKVEVNQ